MSPDQGSTTSAAPPLPPTIEGTARAIAFEGGLVDVEAARLRGATAATVLGSKIGDAAGASKGRGQVIAKGGDIEVTGPSLDMTFFGDLRLGAGSPAFVHGRSMFEFLQIRAGSVTLSAPELAFSPTGSATSEPIAGPVKVTVLKDQYLGVRADGNVDWVNPPSAFHFVRGTRARPTMSWSGDGVVRSDGREHRARHLGVKAWELDVSVERTGATYLMRGSARLLQVYTDGVPQLAAKGRVRIKSRPGSVARGERGWFTWAPENDGATDFTITRIRPDSPAAAWVSLGLARLPAMCGGEACPARGGDTSGLRSGKPIDAVIIPGTGDESDVSFGVPLDAPLGRHQIALVVEGNFEPIRVVVDVDVVERGATTAPPP